MNRDQLWNGIVNIDKPGGKEKYAPSTIRSKRKAPYNKTDYITLKWFGDFHKSIYLKDDPDEIFFLSDNEVWVKYLQPNTKTSRGRFEHALGLTDDNIEKMRDIVKDELIERIRDVI